MGADGDHAQPADAIPGIAGNGLRSWLSSLKLRSKISESQGSSTVAGPRCNVRHAPRRLANVSRNMRRRHLGIDDHQLGPLLQQIAGDADRSGYSWNNLGRFWVQSHNEISHNISHNETRFNETAGDKQGHQIQTNGG
jgi:hypothetical protein